MACVLALAACHDSGPDAEVGGACIDDRDCAERCERGGDFPGGFCTLSCIDDRDCPVDTICAEVEGGVCLYPCELHADCDFLGRDYFCRDRRDTFDRPILVCMGD
jgi:hypothetical protein